MLEIYFCDKLRDKDIVCYIYKEAFNLSYKEIAQRRGLKVDEVVVCVNRIRRIMENHKEVVAAIQAVFCSD